LTISSKPGLLAANPRINNLDLAVKPFTGQIHHCPAEFMEHHPCISPVLRRLCASEPSAWKMAGLCHREMRLARRTEMRVSNVESKKCLLEWTLLSGGTGLFSQIIEIAELDLEQLWHGSCNARRGVRV
jgi:hypothetical protein